MHLWKLFSWYLNLALFELSFYLGEGEGLHLAGRLSRKRKVRSVPPGEGGPSLTVSFLGFINGFLPHLAVNLRPKEFIGSPNAHNAAWRMKCGRHNPISSFLKTTLKWTILARKLKQYTDLNNQQSYFPWFGRILRHFTIWITKHYLCIFWWQVTATVYSQKLKLMVLLNRLSALHT